MSRAGCPCGIIITMKRRGLRWLLILATVLQLGSTGVWSCHGQEYAGLLWLDPCPDTSVSCASSILDSSPAFQEPVEPCEPCDCAFMPLQWGRLSDIKISFIGVDWEGIEPTIPFTKAPKCIRVRFFIANIYSPSSPFVDSHSSRAPPLS